MADLNLCPGCYEEIAVDATFCPHCGLNKTYMHNPEQYLPIGTVLKERYRVGQQLVFNHESVLYYAYDMLSERKVFLKEYFPKDLSVRGADHVSVEIAHGHEAAFKTILHDFMQLSEDLAKFNGLSCLLDIYEMFYENATGYVVLQYQPVVSLKTYVENTEKEFTYEQVKKIFVPFIKALGMLHEAGIVHRGISPETIYISQKGDVKLTGFASASVRTVGGNGPEQVFEGYAAPEQYKTDGWQGEWTDIYGLCASLYFVLAKTNPDPVTSRLENDTLVSVHLLNRKVSKRISSCIMKGMSLETSDRYQNTSELLQELEGTDDSRQSASDSNQKNEQKKTDQSNTPWYLKRWMFGVYAYLATIVLLLIVISIGWAILGSGETGGVINNSSESSSDSSSSSQDVSEVPNFVGKTIAEINEDEEYSRYNLEVTEEYHDSVGVGIIISQDPIAGSEYEDGMTIKVVASKGPESVPMINVVGLSQAQAEQQLTNAGILYDIYEVYSESVESGYVVRTSVLEGETIIPSQQRVQVFVAQ